VYEVDVIPISVWAVHGLEQARLARGQRSDGGLGIEPVSHLSSLLGIDRVENFAASSWPRSRAR
jgi:hypothetical protein